KFSHILGGAFVAFWPFFLSWQQIQLLGLLFFIGMIISIKLDIFRSIHAVRRNGVGEMLAAFIIIVFAFICDDKWIYMAAMLHLSLADGLAAISGLAFGEHNSYKVLGETRSLAGNL